ncbi:LacI family DNA-binding transcriptional regulator [Isoptericola sp. NPDC057653]|uniref:LacI family DNA-binding transcriptional regulator n=1 Tax=unclassified Isoptericola TaxID=2623355 RepID=UPI0036A72BE8
MPDGRRARLSDVAALAGVSPKTVSNVLHDHPYVRDSTRRRVEKALAELDYRANLSARALRGQSTGFIALAIPGLDNPYYSTLAGHVIDECARHDWTVLIEQTRSLESLERAAVRGPASRLVDGVILQPDALGDAELEDRFAHRNLVLIGESEVAPSADRVSADNVAAARALAEHLLARGRRRVAVVGLADHPRANASSLRYRGVATALQHAGLDLAPDYRVDVPRFRRGEGAEAADRLLALPVPPDAIVCYNDLLASGVLARLRERGVAVPDDVAVAGFDDNDESSYTAPALTSVSWDLADIARRCVERLHLRSAPGAAATEPVRAVVGHRLMVRASTGGA